MAHLTFVNSKDGILEDYQGKTRNQELALQLKIDDELNTALKDMATDKESLAQADSIQFFIKIALYRFFF